MLVSKNPNFTAVTVFSKYILFTVARSFNRDFQKKPRTGKNLKKITSKIQSRNFHGFKDFVFVGIISQSAARIPKIISLVQLSQKENPKTTFVLIEQSIVISET